ncbi:Dabb family protein [Akkermansiaceae bacterium]|nr:Dabb family protein [Akkermansiaceae bacterium]
MVRHFGVFKFHPDVDATRIGACFSAMEGMCGKIDGLLTFEHGPYQSDEGLNDGFTHGFIMTFDSAASRDAYLPHPIHEAVKDIVVPCLERVIVFDFAVQPKTLPT